MRRKDGTPLLAYIHTATIEDEGGRPVGLVGVSVGVSPHRTEPADLAPGAALDVGCGEGADAIWLADHGWRVTAVELSTVALERAAAQALEIGVKVAQRIDWLHADLTDWVPPASYDLLSAQFMPLPKNRARRSSTWPRRR